MHLEIDLSGCRFAAVSQPPAAKHPSSLQIVKYDGSGGADIRRDVPVHTDQRSPRKYRKQPHQSMHNSICNAHTPPHACSQKKQERRNGIRVYARSPNCENEKDYKKKIPATKVDSLLWAARAKSCVGGATRWARVDGALGQRAETNRYRVRHNKLLIY